jgi:hypothetical protein
MGRAVENEHASDTCSLRIDKSWTQDTKKSFNNGAAF